MGTRVDHEGKLLEVEAKNIEYPIQRTPARFMDLIGNHKVAQFENIYDADFEYSEQTLRWERLVFLGGSILHLPQAGGVRLQVGTASGDIAIRQSRPYHRYQPGKTMAMASNILMGAAIANNRQRLGFFDDSNGCFFDQADPDNGNNNPNGMGIVVRSDISGLVVDSRVPMHQWNGNKDLIASIDWSVQQMAYIEYTWYGGGSVKFGVMLDGQPYILHQENYSNRTGQTVPWCRTGNLPVRYETRNIAATAQSNSLIHYGVSVGIWGGSNAQRGFTYTYGMALGQPTRTVAAASTRFPLLSIRMRPMGTQEYTQANAALTAGTTTSASIGTTPWTVNQWRGRCFNYTVAGVSHMARITANTNNTLTLVDPVRGGPLAVAPVAGQPYTIGLVNRGQLLPKRLWITSTALAQAELFFSTPTSPIVLTGANFVGMNTLGSGNSFAQRDVSATAFTGGERVKKFPLPGGGSGIEPVDLSDLFPLYNNIQGTVPDIITLAITTQAGTPTNAGGDFDAQEAMS
jgi:hypothetical protein